MSEDRGVRGNDEGKREEWEQRRLRRGVVLNADSKPNVKEFDATLSNNH